MEKSKVSYQCLRTFKARNDIEIPSVSKGEILYQIEPSGDSFNHVDLAVHCYVENTSNGQRGFIPRCIVKECQPEYPKFQKLPLITENE